MPADIVDEDANALFAAIGRAISAWNGVEYRLNVIFSSCLTMQLIDAQGNSSHGDWTPNAVLNSVDGFRVKLQMIDAALSSCVFAFDDGGDDILKAWAAEQKKIGRLSKNRNILAHWRVAMFSSTLDGPGRPLLVPPFMSTSRHDGFTETDVKVWQASFTQAGKRLGERVVAPLAAHRPLQHKFLRITADQIRSVHHSDPSYLDFLRQELSGLL